MQPVWVLSVDLQTKTATFQSGLSDAAKSARGAFTQIKEGSGEMGREVSGNMMEARHGVILLGEEFGVHLPRGVTSFLASIGPVGAAMEAAFPFLAIAVGATILIEHLVKMHEAGVKLTEDQGKFGLAAQNAFNQLDQKLIQAQIRSDELKNDHIGALKLQLELIDKQSMEELVHSFDLVAKAADVVFADLKTSWYQFGAGSDAAKASLERLHTQYAALQSVGKSDEASALLNGALSREQKILDLRKQYVASQGKDGGAGDYKKFEEARSALKAMGVSIASNTAGIEGETAAQQQMVDAVTAMVTAEKTVAEIKKTESANTVRTTAGTMSGEASARAKEAAESQQRIAQQGLTAAKAVVEAQLTIKRASIQERLAVDLDFSKRELELQMTGNAAQIKALDKLSKDYPNALKALQDKSLELEAAHSAQVAELTSKAAVALHDKDIQTLEESEREKIEATLKGTAERIAAINAAIKQEEAAGQADTNYYRELLVQRVEAVRQAEEEASRIKDAAIKQDIAARNEAAQEMTRHAAAMSKIATPKGGDDFAAQAKEIQKEYDAKHSELALELADSQSMGLAKVAEQQRINDQIAALDKKHQDQMAENAAAQAQSEKVAAMETANAWGQAMLRVGEGHESMAKVARQAFDSMIANSLQAALMEVAHEKTAQLAHAEAAAAAAWHAMSAIPVVGPVLGAAAAAATFAGAMAFQGGTDNVPGVGIGDIVPARLEPGEGVVPKDVMGGLRDLWKNGGLQNGGNVTHVHIRPTYHVNTIDGDGMQDALEKHTDVLTTHVERTLRKMNR